MPECHTIWVQYTDRDLDNTFTGHVPSFPVLYFGWTLPNQIRKFQEFLPPGKTIYTTSKRCKNTQQWILHSHTQYYAVAIWTKYKDTHGWADCVDRFIRIVKQSDMMYIVPFSAIVGQADLMRENAASNRTDSCWIGNYHPDFKYLLNCILSFNAWITMSRRKIVNWILIFEINIIMLNPREYGSRVKVHWNRLQNAASTPNSSKICTF